MEFLMPDKQKKTQGRQSKGFQNSQKAVSAASSKSNKVTNQTKELSAQDFNIMSKSKKVNAGSKVDPTLSNSSTSNDTQALQVTPSTLGGILALVDKQPKGGFVGFTYKAIPEGLLNTLIYMAIWDGHGVTIDGDVMRIHNNRGAV
jgi:hypothetical protein